MRIFKKILRNSFSIFAKMSPVLASQVIFFKTFNRKLNLKNPKTFNEKLMWLKLFEDDTIKTKLTDKYLVRNYISQLGYGNLLIDLYGVYESVEEIDFEQLPKSFVIKCTHGSGFNIICTDKAKLDRRNVIKILKKWMNTNFSLLNAELHYSSIKPRIIVEKLLEGFDGKALVDYKFHCFHGQPKVIEVVLDRWTEHKKNIMYNCNWEILRYTNDSLKLKNSIEKPNRLDEMLEIAKNLSSEFTYVRVDLYFFEESIYFGELTFTPAACVDRDITEDADNQMGKLLDISYQLNQ